MSFRHCPAVSHEWKPRLHNVSVLVVGAGTMGSAHTEALAAMPAVSLAGIASEDYPRARQLAERYKTRAFRNIAEALRLTRPDAVYVCIPTTSHKAVVLQAAAAGLHVFCEKPLAASLQDGEAMIKACRKAGVIFMVGHVLRFFPEFILMRRLVHNGELGSPAVIRVSRGGQFPRGLGNWYANVKASGGPLLDLVIHDFDWLRWTFGKVQRVYARTHYRLGNRTKGPPLAYTLTVLRFARGSMAHVEGFWGHDLPFRVKVELAGSKALAEYDSQNPVVVSMHRAETRSGKPAVAVPESPLAKSPYTLEDEHFIHSVRHGVKPSVTGEDALEAIRIGLAALQSARSGKAVSL